MAEPASEVNVNDRLHGAGTGTLSGACVTSSPFDHISLSSAPPLDTVRPPQTNVPEPKSHHKPMHHARATAEASSPHSCQPHPSDSLARRCAPQDIKRRWQQRTRQATRHTRHGFAPLNDAAEESASTSGIPLHVRS
jgi:hypothetical protein